MKRKTGGDYESETRKYHGNLSFKTDTVFETRPDAERYLKQFHGHLKDVAVIYKHREDSATKKSDLIELDKKIATETRNIAIKTKKFELKWLVKAEVHC